MKVFLDDIRGISDEEQYNTVRTYDDCITLIGSLRDHIETISLDYHLGEDSKQTGYDVLVYMRDNEIEPRIINLHSDHEKGLPLMEKYAKKNFPNSKIMTNKVKKE